MGLKGLDSVIEGKCDLPAWLIIDGEEANGLINLLSTNLSRVQIIQFILQRLDS